MQSWIFTIITVSLMFLRKPWYIDIFFMIIWWIESSKEQLLFEMVIFKNVNVFTVIFDQCNVSVLNKSMGPTLY